MTDWSGHVPAVENYQLQFSDGRPVHLQDQATDFNDEAAAIKFAQQLSEDWHVPVVVRRTS